MSVLMVENSIRDDLWRIDSSLFWHLTLLDLLNKTRHHIHQFSFHTNYWGGGGGGIKGIISERLKPIIKFSSAQHKTKSLGAYRYKYHAYIILVSVFLLFFFLHYLDIVQMDAFSHGFVQMICLPIILWVWVACDTYGNGRYMYLSLRFTCMHSHVAVVAGQKVGDQLDRQQWQHRHWIWTRKGKYWWCRLKFVIVFG